MSSIKYILKQSFIDSIYNCYCSVFPVMFVLEKKVFTTFILKTRRAIVSTKKQFVCVVQLTQLMTKRWTISSSCQNSQF